MNLIMAIMLALVLVELLVLLIQLVLMALNFVEGTQKWGWNEIIDLIMIVSPIVLVILAILTFALL